MSAIVILPEEIARRRSERERKRREREALKGSILALDDDDQQHALETPAPEKETGR